ncbi:MAG: DNA polymerase Y family protein [Pseudomonadota bacterium]
MVRTARTSPHRDLFAGLGPPAPPARHPEAATTPPVASERAPQVDNNSRRARAPLWVCVQFPGLPLQAVRGQCEPGGGRAHVVVDNDRQRTVIARDRAARRAGIAPGQRLKAAMALASDATIIDRDAAAEAALLEDIARDLIAFSATVSLAPPQAVLIEVRGSLRLFGGIAALLERLTQQLHTRGCHLRYSVAPTATAATWLALAGAAPDPDEVVADGVAAGSYLRALNALDIGVTGWPSETVAALREMGVATIADCRRLPRAGLARRFGPAPLHALAQAFGELPEVRQHVEARQQFESLLQLDAEIEAAPQLHLGCERLLGELENWLRCRQGAVRQLAFRFHGWRGLAGVLDVALSAPGHTLADWQRLLAAHLERCALSQPAVAVSLAAQISDPLGARVAALAFEPGQTSVPDAPELHALLDRLQARLGERSVQALRHVAEHRPEYASRTVTPDAGTHAGNGAGASLPAAWVLRDVPAGVLALQREAALLLQRPLWLTGRPVALTTVAGVPHFEGALTLRHGPERIASGWWETAQAGEADGADDNRARDYFVAENPVGVRLWIFRERIDDTEVRWRLHGIFG